MNISPLSNRDFWGLVMPDNVPVEFHADGVEVGTCGGFQIRRRVIKAGFALTFAALYPTLAQASNSSARRELKFLNLHTGESLRVTYWRNGIYLSDELEAINWVLRDFRTGATFPIATELLDLLFSVQRLLDTTRPFEVISGYRSAATNAQLRNRSASVAKASLHTRGQAIDVRVPNRGLVQVRDAARQISSGGVGYYPRSQFVHLDVGRVRFWQGA